MYLPMNQAVQPLFNIYIEKSRVYIHIFYYIYACLCVNIYHNIILCCIVFSVVISSRYSKKKKKTR